MLELNPPIKLTTTLSVTPHFLIPWTRNFPKGKSGNSKIYGITEHTQPFVSLSHDKRT